MKKIIEFIGLYLGIIVVIYGIFPLGIAALSAGWLFYGSFKSALTFYEAHMVMAATSIMGLIPFYGIKLHFTFSHDNIIPWAISNGLSISWLISLSGLLSGILCAICPVALILRIFEDKLGIRSGSTIFLLLTIIYAISASIYSGILFFSL